MNEEDIKNFIEKEIIPTNKELISYFIHHPNLKLNIDFEIIFKIPFSLDYRERKVIYSKISESLDSYLKDNGSNFSFLLIFVDT